MSLIFFSQFFLLLHSFFDSFSFAANRFSCEYFRFLFTLICFTPFSPIPIFSFFADNYLQCARVPKRRQKKRTKKKTRASEENLIRFEFKCKWMDKVENWGNLLISSDRCAWMNQSTGLYRTAHRPFRCRQTHFWTPMSSNGRWTAIRMCFFFSWPTILPRIDPKHFQ